MKSKLKDSKAESPSFECAECGYESAKWAGKCPQCEAWNTFVQRAASLKKIEKAFSPDEIREKIRPLADLAVQEQKRITIGIAEWDRVLGGGLVAGSVILVGGIPGIGKSTLLLQTAVALGQKGKTVLYASAEESINQIKLRSARVGESPQVHLVCEADLDVILECAEQLNPCLLIIDSIQVMYSSRFGSSSGSVTQIRECAFALTRFAKKQGITVCIVGHVTKDGAIAGPKVLEHIVDTVIYFEGEDASSLRMVRVQKNRFGPTDELGIFEMTAQGLKEVGNPSLLFLSHRQPQTSGAVITPVIEGTRIFFLELQALTVKTNADFVRRTANGIDPNRMNIILAILERRAGIRLWQTDVFINVVGGMKVFEVAADLGIALAVISSMQEKSIAHDSIAFGELGLSGELRPVAQAEARVKEAAKLGFKRCILPAVQAASMSHIKGIEIVGVAFLKDAVQMIQ